MIDYESGYWLPLFSFKGSVLFKAARWAVPFAILAAIGSVLLRGLDTPTKAWLEEMKVGDRLRDFSFILGFLIVFRSQTAYSRWWEAGTLLQQLRGEWFNSFSSLLAFCNTDPKKKQEVQRFQHLLIRLICLLYANALKQVSAMGDNSFELIDIQGFDADSLKEMVTAHDSCEVVAQWIQRLIVQANTNDIVKIAPPILSRVYEQLGKGIVRLNNARKIRQFPIPFPVAQLVAFMLVFHGFLTALVTSIMVDSWAIAACMSFMVVEAYWSLNFIALELEQPYGDDPNDLPLHDMMEDLNQSLCGLVTPHALSPPEFEYDTDRDMHLPKHKTHFEEHLEERKASGKVKRRRNSVQ